MPQQGRATHLATTFRFAGVAAAYAFRPPYPAEVFDVLESLIVDEPRHVLDLGAGDGALARPLAPRVGRVDAVEVSPAMVERGRTRPGGDRENLRWLVTAAETMPVSGPYALVTAGASLHWMDWDATLSRVGRVLSPHGMLVLVDQRYHRMPWQDALVDVIVRHSRSPDFDPAFSLPDELDRLGLLDIRGRHETAAVDFPQSVDGYVEQFHSTASLARELMSPDEADGFDEEVRAVVRAYRDREGMLPLRITASMVWGRPVTPAR